MPSGLDPGRQRQSRKPNETGGLTNSRSEPKIENHIYAVNLFYMHYNFCRIHQTLRVTPAMEAGISSHVWSIQEIVTLSAGRLVKAA